MNLRKVNIYTILIWGIVILFTGLYFSLIFSINIVTDEAFTLKVLRLDLTGMFELMARDVHPPIFYLYIKPFYLLFGESLIALKIAVLIPMVLTLVVGATIIRKHFGDTVSLIYLLFISCLPCTMEFSVQVRMYSLALLSVTLCGIYAYLARIDGKKQYFIICGLSGVVAAYSHYFAFISTVVIVGIMLLTILIWKKERFFSWLITAVGMIILYLPWIPTFHKQVTAVTTDYWIPEITGDTIWSYFKWTFGSTLVPWIVFVFIIIWWITSNYNTVLIFRDKKEEDIFARICLAVPIITAILGITLSWLTRPIYRDQYILPALGLFALYFGITIRNARKSIIIVLSAFLLFVGAVQYKEVYQLEYKSSNIYETMAFFEENLQDDDYIIYNWELFDFIYLCHFPKEQLVYYKDFDFSGDFRNVWFLNTFWLGEGVSWEVLDENGLTMEYIDGEFGIEHNIFEIQRIYHY